MISYQTAYLKAHYPSEYMCAFLSSVIDNQERVVFYIRECQNMGIKVLPPDINESYENFTVAREGIRFGLGAIKNVGLGAVKNIVETRKEGPFKSLFDFCRRVNLGYINKRVLENLIVSGCFDSVGITRKQALSIMEECIDLSNKIEQGESSHQMSLFGDTQSLIQEPVPELKGEMPLQNKLAREKEVLGFYVSQNPLDEYSDLIHLIVSHQIADLDMAVDNTYVRVVGMITNLSRKVSRKGDSYARMYLEDRSGRVEVLVFPSAYRSYADRLQIDKPVVIEGFYDTHDEQPKVVLRKITEISSTIRELHIRISDKDEAKTIRNQVITKLTRYPGEIKVLLRLAGDKRALLLDNKFNVTASSRLKEELITICGKNNVWFC